MFFRENFIFIYFLFPNTFFIIRFFIYLLSAPIKSFTVSSENISNDFLKVFFFFPLFYFSFKLCWKWWSKRFLTFVTIYLPHCILPFSKIKMLLYCETTFRSVKGFRKKILFVIDGNVYFGYNLVHILFDYSVVLSYWLIYLFITLWHSDGVININKPKHLKPGLIIERVHKAL